MSVEEKQRLWMNTVEENVYVICKTPMAKAITKRTLVGYSEQKINTHNFDDLVNVMQNKPQAFSDKVQKKSYWKKGKGTMHFDAIVGNPPYQSTTLGGIDNGKAARQAKPIFQLFVEQAKKVQLDYISMIIPARWYNGGIGLNDFRTNMMNDRRLEKLVDFYNA